MIRWSFVLPRLIAVVLIVLAVWLGTDPSLRWIFSAAGGRVVGAKVDIGAVATSLTQTQIALCDIHVADPSSPMKNLFEAARIDLSMERDPLLRKRWVVQEGRISGLKFGTPRATSGTLDKLPHGFDAMLDRVPKLAGRFQVAAEQWMDTLAGLLERGIERQLDELESVRLAKELSLRWPADFRRMEDRVLGIRRRVEELQQLQRPSRGQTDVLVNVENGLRAVDDIESLRRDVAKLRKEFDGLTRQAITDRDAVEQAGRRDAEQVRQALAIDRLEGQGLTEFLLGPELSERIATLASWIRWVRRYAPQQVETPKPTRRRGIDVAFAGLKPQPDFLVRMMTLDGEGEIDRKPFRFTGVAEGITSQPVMYGRPAVVKIAVQGAAAMTIEAVLDRTKSTPRDTLLVHCPAIVQPKRTLGRADRLAVAVSPGTARLDLELELEGDRLAGRLVIHQAPVRLTPSFPARGVGPLLEEALCDAVADVQAIDVEVDLSGTLDSPAWRVRSELGAQLADAVRRAAQGELNARGQALAKAVGKRIDAAAGGLERLLADRQDQLLGALDLSRDELAQLKDTIARNVPVRDLAEQNARRLGVRPEVVDRNRDTIRKQKERLEKELPVKLPVRF